MRAILDERISGFITALANKAYDQLSQFVTVNPSWLRAGESPEKQLASTVAGIEECFALWEEEEERAFFIDPYVSEQLKDFDWSDGSGFAVYWPTCRGEELDFWFEVVLELDDQGQPLVFVQINV